MKILKKSILFTLTLGANIDASSAQGYEFSYDLLYALVPYEPVSIRGAVMSLRDESLVAVYQRDKQTRISLTSIGRETVRSLFPGFKNQAGRRDHTWTVCLFLDVDRSTPISKKNTKPVHVFRPIREALLGHGFYALERGMYVLPRTVSPSFAQELAKQKTLNRVLVFETRRMVVGDERQVIRSLFDIGKLSFTRQGIIKTLESLEKKAGERSALHPQSRASFISLVPKLMDFFAQDISIPDIYFPQDIKLSDTKELLSRVSAEILPKLLLQ